MLAALTGEQTRLGGKILYRSSDIEKLLDGCYREARTRPEEL